MSITGTQHFCCPKEKLVSVDVDKVLHGVQVLRICQMNTYTCIQPMSTCEWETHNKLCNCSFVRCLFDNCLQRQMVLCFMEYLSSEANIYHAKQSNLLDYLRITWIDNGQLSIQQDNLRFKTPSADSNSKQPSRCHSKIRGTQSVILPWHQTQRALIYHPHLIMQWNYSNYSDIQNNSIDNNHRLLQQSRAAVAPAPGTVEMKSHRLSTVTGHRIQMFIPQISNVTTSFTIS